MWLCSHLILDVDGDVLLLPENSSHQNRDRRERLHQGDHRRLHEGQVGERGGGQQEGLGRASLFGQVWKNETISAVVAQLAERLLLTPEIQGLNPNVGKILSIN